MEVSTHADETSSAADILAVWSPISSASSKSSGTKTMFRVEGNPSSQLRYNRGKAGNAYDPSKKAKTQFRSKVESMLGLSGSNQPLFPSHVLLSITLVFRMRRPNNHFVGRQRDSTKLSSGAPPPFVVTKCDVDNLLKFVMDAMNMLIYADDKQVAAVHMFRLYDCDGSCKGCFHYC